MKKFEYKTIEFETDDNRMHKSIHIDSNDITETLNNLGNDGWELVSTVDYALNGYTVKVIFFLKREK